ncbi:MAG: FAD-dependent oxidoreductase, partial [Candidatus Adiutrix sp.]|nr:FAD-dependent oxidoreductase [Candidatus Adiutrix sp.]
CLGTAWRQGALSVSQFEIMPKPPETRAESNPWPQWPLILRASSSHEEGGVRRWNVATLEFIPANEDRTRLGALNCREVQWLIENGRPSRPEPKPGSEFQEKADLALLALGFTGVEPEPLMAALKLSPDKRGCLPCDQRGRLAPGVYACGDAARGPSLVVRAIADGLAAAETALEDYSTARAAASAFQPAA